MKFFFSLENLVPIREKETQEIQKKLMETEDKIQKMKDMLHRERDFYFDDREKRNENSKLGKIENIKIFDDSLKIRQTRMMQLLEILHDIEKEKKHLERSLTQAKKNEKILSTLKNKKFEEYQKEEEKKEQKNLEENALYKILRQEWEDKNEKD